MSTATKPRRQRRSQSPPAADFSIRLGDVELPVYWQRNSFWPLLRRSDLAPVVHLALPEDAAEWVHVRDLKDWAEGPLFLQLLHLHGAVISAINHATRHPDIIQALIAESPLLAADYALSNQQVCEADRERLLRQRFDDYDQQYQSIWSVLHERLEERRQREGIELERAAVRDAMLAQQHRPLPPDPAEDTDLAFQHGTLRIELPFEAKALLARADDSLDLTAVASLLIHAACDLLARHGERVLPEPGEQP